MGIGTAVRHRLGRFEIPAAEAYRKAFIDLDDLARKLRAAWDRDHPGQDPKRILEVGCGDGSLGQRLTATFPDAEYLGIDPAPTAGRLYRGRTDGATFRVTTSDALVAEGPAPFDLVVVVDVLHHIPAGLRPSVLGDAAALTAGDGQLAVKEWQRGRLVFGRLAYIADRYVTGDENVDFMDGAQLDALIASTLPGWTVPPRDFVRPWRENVLLMLRPPA